MKKYCKKLLLLIFTLLFVLPYSEAQQVEIGPDSAISVFSPICRTRDYCVYEIIYLNSEINTSGDISHFAFGRVDGDNVDPIQNMSLYIKHTSGNQLATGLYSESGYQLVYQGTWPNDAGSGWREVVLSTPFSYDGISNLQVMAVKGYELSLANPPVTPRWYYSTNATGNNRARRYYGNNPIDSTTSLSTINYNANARLTFGSVSVKEIGSSPVSIYPNPAKEQLNLILNDESSKPDHRFELYDISGRIHRSEMIDKSKVISLQDVPQGMYFYMLRSDEEIWSGKLIVQ